MAGELHRRCWAGLPDNVTAVSPKSSDVFETIMNGKDMIGDIIFYNMI